MDHGFFVGVIGLRLGDCCIAHLTKDGSNNNSDDAFHILNPIAGSSIPALYIGSTKSDDVIYCTQKASVVLVTSKLGITKELADVTPYFTSGLYVTAKDKLLLSVVSCDPFYFRSKVIRMTLTGAVVDEIGKDKDGRHLFDRPGPLTLSPDNDMYVIDGYNKIVCVVDKTLTGSYTCNTGSRFVALDCDAMSNVHVCDVKNHCIKSFNRSIQPLGVLNLHDSLPTLRDPVCIVCHRGKLYVSHNDHKVSEINLKYVANKA